MRTAKKQKQKMSTCRAVKLFTWTSKGVDVPHVGVSAVWSHDASGPGRSSEPGYRY